MAMLLCKTAARLRVIGITICITVSPLPVHAEGVLSQSTAPRDLQSIIDTKRLRVAVTRFDLPSFHTHRPDGTLVGAEIEMAQQIGRALGVKVEFIDDADSFDAVVNLVAADRADIGISKLSQTYRRLHLVRFSEPYIILRHAILFTRSMIAQDTERRPPAAVGVIAGSAYVDFAKANFPAA